MKLVFKIPAYNFMNFETGKWNEHLTGRMSLENIRKLYQPESHYSIGWNEYPAGSEFGGWSRKRKLYIISGSCKVTVNEHSMGVCEGEFLDLPEGDYHLSVSTDSNIEIVSVWEIPEQYRLKNDPF